MTIHQGDPGDEHQEPQVCSRPEPHECMVNGPCNGWPRVGNAAATQSVVLAANNGHEEHPESLRPRVFYSVVQDEGGHGEVFYVRHYEILQTGYAIPWKTLPEGKFDFLHFIVKTPKQVRLSHADNPSPAYWAGTLLKISEPVGPSIPTLEGR